MADFSRPVSLHLNDGNRWSGFSMQGLEVEGDGVVRLASLPAVAGMPDPALARLPTPTLSAGIAVADDGRVIWSDPAAGRLLSRDLCDGVVAPLPCLGRDAPFGEPRGLTIHPTRRALMVADARRHQVLILSHQLDGVVESWGEPGEAPGRFLEPSSLATLGADVYVVDRGNQRLQKLDATGRPDPQFAATVASAGRLSAPLEVATRATEAGGEILVLETNASIVVLGPDGRLLRTLPLPGTGTPMGLVANAASLYLGNNASRSILRLTPDGEVLGEAVGYLGPVAAMAVAGGDLWAIPGGEGAAAVRLAIDGGHVARGVLWGGPIQYGEAAHAWGRLSAHTDPLPAGGRFRLFWTTRPPAAPPAAGSGGWTAGPPNGVDVWVGAESPALWVGAQFAGDGRVSPRLTQLRLDADREPCSRYLPPLYLRDPATRPTLDRFLALFESQFTDLEDRITDLTRLFAADTVPAAWLPWLAGWLDVADDERWEESKRRQAMARAPRAAAARGTAAAIEDALWFELGVRAVVQEPLLLAAWWALPPTGAEPVAAGTSALGLTTTLPLGSPQGAVIGTTAELDRSRLITDAEFGAPLFDDLAHRFTVLVGPAGADCGDLQERVRAVVEEEKPAHTLYEICILQPAMTIGVQSVLGIDTIVAGDGPPPTPIGDETAVPTSSRGSADGLVLAGDPPGRLGRVSAIGRETRLGGGGSAGGWPA